MTLPTTRLTEFLPHVLPHALRCPRPVAEFMLRQSAIEFCKRTRCWRHIVTITLTAPDQGIAIAAPAFTNIHEIETATLDGRTLTPTQFTTIQPDQLTGETMAGQPEYITQIDPNTVCVFPYGTGVLRLSLFLKPAEGKSFGTDAADPLHDAFNVVPPFMLTQYAEALAAGALSRILMIERQSFSSPEKAAINMAKFDEACGASHTTSMRGQQRAKLRTPPRFM